VVRETPKRTEENRHWKYPEYKNGLRYKGLKQLLQDSKQMMEPTPNGIEGWSQGKQTHQRIGGIRKKEIYEIFGEKIMEHVVGTSIRLQKIRKDWSLWRGRPPPKWKKGNGPYGRNR
jgi:hypothetical protein